MGGVLVLEYVTGGRVLPLKNVHFDQSCRPTGRKHDCWAQVKLQFIEQYKKKYLHLTVSILIISVSSFLSSIRILLHHTLSIFQKNVASTPGRCGCDGCTGGDGCGGDHGHGGGHWHTGHRLAGGGVGHRGRGIDLGSKVMTFRTEMVVYWKSKYCKIWYSNYCKIY